MWNENRKWNKNNPIIDENNQNIIFEITTKLYANFYDPDIFDLEAGIYGSSSPIIGEDNLLIKGTGKNKFKKISLTKILPICTMNPFIVMKMINPIIMLTHLWEDILIADLNKNK